MSSNNEFSSDEERDFEDDEYYSSDDESESSEEEAHWVREHWVRDIRLFEAVERNAAEAVQQAIRDGANVDGAYVNDVRDGTTPLMIACEQGYDQIIRILLDAGADARLSRGREGWSAILAACSNGHLSTVRLLTNHDKRLLHIRDAIGSTPLMVAIRERHFDIVRLLLKRRVDPRRVNRYGETALMIACQRGSLETVRLLLAAGVDVEDRDRGQRTALHYAVDNDDRSELLRELILQHNANMFAVDKYGRTPFDDACNSNRTADVVDHLLEMYGNKLTHDHGRLAVHELLKLAEYSFAEEKEFHPPLDPFRIILPLGKLTLVHLRILLHTLDPELIRNRDDTGKLPLHIACQANAPVEVLALFLELDPTALHIADYTTGALPIHLLCGTATAAATEYASVRYLVEQGGVGTLAARNRQGLLPLHVLCGSRSPPLQAVQCLIQSFSGSVAVQTDAGEYPFMMVSAESSSSSLSVLYELARANPGLVVPK